MRPWGSGAPDQCFCRSPPPQTRILTPLARHVITHRSVLIPDTTERQSHAEFLQRFDRDSDCRTHPAGRTAGHCASDAARRADSIDREQPGLPDIRQHSGIRLAGPFSGQLLRRTEHQMAADRRRRDRVRIVADAGHTTLGRLVRYAEVPDSSGIHGCRVLRCGVRATTHEAPCYIKSPARADPAAASGMLPRPGLDVCRHSHSARHRPHPARCPARAHSGSGLVRRQPHLRSCSARPADHLSNQLPAVVPGRHSARDIPSADGIRPADCRLDGVRSRSDEGQPAHFPAD